MVYCSLSCLFPIYTWMHLRNIHCSTCIWYLEVNTFDKGFRQIGFIYALNARECFVMHPSRAWFTGMCNDMRSEPSESSTQHAYTLTEERTLIHSGQKQLLHPLEVLRLFLKIGKVINAHTNKCKLSVFFLQIYSHGELLNVWHGLRFT